jgi:integrase
MLSNMRIVAIDECFESTRAFWDNGGFVDLGPDYVIDLGPDCDSVTSATPSPAQAGAFMPRRRFQLGRMYVRGKRRPHWFGSYREDTTLSDGTPKRIRRTVKLGPVSSMSTRSAKAAFQKHLDRVNVIAAPPPSSGKKVKDFITEWLAQVAVHQADSSIRAVKSHINSHIIPRLGDCALTDVNNRTVQAFVTTLATGGRTRKTIDNVLNTLSSILRSAKTFNYACGQFSRRELKLPRRSFGREVRSLELNEVGRIIAVADEPYKTMFAILGMAGLRSSELRGLKVIDLDFERRLIHVRRSVDSRTRGEQATKNGLTATVPMPAGLEKRLKNFLKHHWRDNLSGYLFVNRNGNVYAHGKIIQYGLWPAQDACGITRSGLHAFRHQLSSELLEAGVAPAVVTKQMRHSDSRVTLQHYSHVVGDAQRVGVSSVAARIEQHVDRQLESGS